MSIKPESYKDLSIRPERPKYLTLFSIISEFYFKYSNPDFNAFLVLSSREAPIGATWKQSERHIWMPKFTSDDSI